MYRVEHRQLTVHRSHSPIVSNIFHCKRPRSVIPSLFHLLRKSNYDYATEPFFDLLDTRTPSGPYPRDSGRRRLSDHIESRCARRCHPVVLICRSPEYVGRRSSPRPASSASEPPRRRYRPRAGPASGRSAVNLVGVCLLPSRRVQAPGDFNRDAAWTRGVSEDRYCLDRISRLGACPNSGCSTLSESGSTLGP